MKRKAAVAVLAALMSVTMLACGSNTSSSPKTTSSTKTESMVSQTTESSSDFIDMMSFLKDGEIYFDVQVTDAIKDLKITVDGKDALGEKKVPFTANSEFAIDAVGEPGKKVCIYLVSGKADNGIYQYTQAISQGFDAEKASERLGKLLSDYQKDSAKLYFAITEEPKGWDHSLSEKLNEFLNGYVK